MNTVCIIIPTWNNENQLRTCLESIRRYTRDCDYRICVVNNGSDEKTKQVLTNLVEQDMRPFEMVVLSNSENLGFIKATNQGLRQLNPNEHALLLNDDTQIVDPYWLAKMTLSLEFAPLAGAVGPTSNYVMGWQGVQYSTQLPMLHETKFLIGFCMLLKNTAIADVGLLDERFGMGMNEDLDYSIRLADAGYKLYVDRSVFIVHYGSQSLTRLPEQFAQQEARTRQMLINKWGEDTVNDLFTPMEAQP